jgi:hypothetical protein
MKPETNYGYMFPKHIQFGMMGMVMAGEIMM